MDHWIKRRLRNFTLWMVIGLHLFALFALIQPRGTEDIPYSRLLNDVDQGRVRDVVVQGAEIHGTFADGGQFRIHTPNDPTLLRLLYSKKDLAITTAEPMPLFVMLLVSWGPFIALLGTWIFFSRRLRAARNASPPD